MRPRGISLISKGILAFKKGIALITKGVLDDIIRVRGGQPGREVSWFWDIIGIKKFAFRKIYEIIGIKKFTFVYRLTIVGKRAKPVATIFAMKAIKRKKLDIPLQLAGAKVFGFNKELLLRLAGTREGIFLLREIDIGGYKRYEFEDYLDLAGIRAFDFGIKHPMLAQKTVDFKNRRKLKGTKELHTDNKILIKGKRDIKNILIALDME